MEDSRIWEFEESLWKADPEHYRRSISDACVTVVPSEPHLLVGAEWANAASDTPRWDEVSFSEQRVSRPQEGLIVIGYRADAKRGGEDYTAWCTTTMQRRGHDDWVVVQHQQTPPLVAKQSANT